MLTSKQKSDWVTALRSGEFEQGAGQLEKEGKFCCLGVLAKINGLPTDAGILVTSRHSSINLAEDPDEFTCFGGFARCGLPRIDNYRNLSEANDNGCPFIQIADHIEQHLPTKD